MSHIPTNQPTQVALPWRTAIRTGAQAFLAFAGVAIIAAPLVSDFVDQFWPGSPVVGWIAVGAAFVGALAVLVTRIMAIEGVNRALESIGLGATPKQ